MMEPLPVKGLLLDYGGGLTPPVRGTFQAFESAHGIPDGHVIELLVNASRTADGGLIGTLERGEIELADFERQVAERLAAAGYPVVVDRLLADLFGQLYPAGRLWDVARRARAAGVRTGLLSNSWGTSFYPQQRLAEHFDVQVISGQVGLRKPDPAIFHLACERLGVAAGDCVFVDDLPRNVEVARSLGMVAVWHDGDDPATAQAVADHLGVDAGPDGFTPVETG